MSSNHKGPKAPPAFGFAMRKQLFKLDPDMTYLNHGSFGVIPKDVAEARMKYVLKLFFYLPIRTNSSHLVKHKIRLD